MSLLLLFAGEGGTPSAPLAVLVETEPAATFGYPIQRPAVEGEWRWVVELLNPADVAAAWIDVTKFYAGDRHQFGADQPFGDARARLVTVQLQIDNVQADTLGVPGDILAPWGHDTTDVFGVDIPLDAGLIMRAGLIRVVESVTVEWNPIWTGRVESWDDESESRGQIRRHVVSVVDTFSDLANVPTIIESSPSTWDVWFEELFTAAGWLFGADLYGDFSDAGLPQDLNMVAAINRMDQGTDPLGLVWRSLRTGRLVVHPAPWDTTNTDRYPNPLLDVYPDGLVFSYSPDFTDIEYIADDGQQPFGIRRNIAGVLNYFVVTMPDDEVYAIDDPVSAARYGIRPFQATWILSNPPVVDDLMAARAYASAEALPLRTTLDHEGFWSAMAIVDHLDPVTIIHATGGGLVVTATGMVRNVVEERTMRFYDGDAVGALSWQSTVQFDLDATETSEALLPVEDLALVSTFTPGFGGPSGAEFSWTNPTQPSITPTEVQTRVLGRSLIWVSEDYPGVGADGTTVNWLSAATAYTFQVRLVRRVNGVITASSPIRELEFTTPAVILPGPIVNPDDPDGPPTGELPSDPECEDETWELQEKGSDGIWTTTETYTHDDVTLLDAGPPPVYTPTVAPTYEDDKIYRFVQFCDGDIVAIGMEFDPPDSVLDPCTIPPALSVAPFDDAILYVPKLCTGFEDADPDFQFEGMVIVEAVSNIAGARGDALAGFGVLDDDPDYRTLIAIDDPEWSDTPGGILAYGEAPQTVGVVQDKSVMVRVYVAEAEDCVLFETAAMQITCTATTAGWRPGVTIYKVGSTISLAGAAVLDLDTVYYITATHDYETGDIKLYVDGVLDNSVGGTDNVATINALPIWRVGAPPSSYITDCALWDRVLAEGELPEPPFDGPGSVTGLALWLDASDTGSITTDPNGVVLWADLSGNNRDAVGAGSGAPQSGTRTVNGLNVIDFDSSDGDQLDSSLGITGITGSPGISIFVVIQQDGTAAASQGVMNLVNNIGTSDLNGVLIELRTDKYALAWGEGNTGSAAGTEWEALHQTTGTATTASARLYSALLDTSARVVRINGSAITLTAFASQGSPVFLQNLGGADLDWQIGVRSGSASRYNGAIAEILVYDRVLSGADLTNIETYLMDKWGL